MPDTPRPQEPRVIDTRDREQVRELAQRYRCQPEHVEEAVERVGPNRTAVELFLTAPRA